MCEVHIWNMVEYSITKNKTNSKNKAKRLIDIEITNFYSSNINQYHIHALKLNLAITLHDLS